MENPSMYELTVLVCCRALVVPVPGVAASRVNGMKPSVLLNLSSGSCALNGMLAVSVPPWASPKVWSRNCPQVHDHWVTCRSEKMFWLTSLNTRLLMLRLFGPDGRPDRPSV